MALLSKDQILKADDLPTDRIPVPEWGGEVLVRTMTGEQRDEFEASQVKINKKGQPEQNLANVRARLVSLVLVDEAGGMLFSAYDIPDLGRKSAKALDRVFEKAQEMNGFSDEDMEKLAQDFSPAPNGDSTSD
ncbi:MULTISPECIES: hypothetical protein [Streptomyces]|uniref:hypothetical protein n=1 Tax=Streptomyces TaxID=1883 RepID=UPI0034372A8A